LVLVVNWEAVGAIAELGGAIGVIVTLIYLSVQLRLNTKGMRSSTFESYRSGAQAINEYIADHATELSRIRTKPKAELSEAEELIGRGWAFQLFNLMEAAYLHHREGVLETEYFESRISAFLYLCKETPSLCRYWDELGQMACTPEFHAFMTIRFDQATT